MSGERTSRTQIHTHTANAKLSKSNRTLSRRCFPFCVLLLLVVLLLNIVVLLLTHCFCSSAEFSSVHSAYFFLVRFFFSSPAVVKIVLCLLMLLLMRFFWWRFYRQTSATMQTSMRSRATNGENATAQKSLHGAPILRWLHFSRKWAQTFFHSHEANGNLSTAPTGKAGMMICQISFRSSCIQTLPSFLTESEFLLPLLKDPSSGRNKMMEKRETT